MTNLSKWWNAYISDCYKLYKIVCIYDCVENSLTLKLIDNLIALDFLVFVEADSKRELFKNIHT